MSIEKAIRNALHAFSCRVSLVLHLLELIINSKYEIRCIVLLEKASSIFKTPESNPC
jgi:hypothetical protein